jgi:hypothetical protein
MKKKPNGIIDILAKKATLKAKVYDTTYNAFQELKQIAEEIALETKKVLMKKDSNIKIEYRDKGEFEAELRMAGDLLFMTMHTNVFEFPRTHDVMKTSYVKENTDRSYCGVIHFYNFLNDSIKYNRINDTGYLIARLFINKDKYFFVEGKREVGFFYNFFSVGPLDKIKLKAIIESTLLYCINFDLLTPPYELVQETTVQDVIDNNNYLKIKTGKRLGFRFQADHDDKK